METTTEEASQLFGCIFCYKNTDLFKNSHEPQNVDENQNDFQKRVFTLLFRHLKGVDNQNEKLHSSFLEGKGILCQDCTTIVEEFCNLYHQINCLELRVNWQIDKLWNVMRCADQVPLKTQQLRNAGKNGNHKRKIDYLLDFRKHLKRRCEIHKNKLFPRISIPHNKPDIISENISPYINKCQSLAPVVQYPLLEAAEGGEAMELECELSDLTIKTVTSLRNPLDKVDSLNNAKTTHGEDSGVNPMHVPGSSHGQRKVGQVSSAPGSKRSSFEKILPPPPPIHIIQQQTFFTLGNGIKEKKVTAETVGNISTWTCSICSSAYSRKAGLMHHKITCHIEDFFLASKLRCMPTEQLRSCALDFANKKLNLFKKPADKCMNKGAKKFRCGYCSLHYSSRQNTLIHLFEKHHKILEKELEHLHKTTELADPIAAETVTPGNRARKCSYCGEFCTTLATLRRHEKEMHPNIFGWTCSICSTEFSNKTGLLQHDISFHIENFFMDSKPDCFSSEQFRNYVVQLVDKTVESCEMKSANNNEPSKGNNVKYKCKYCSLQLASKYSTTVHLFWQHVKTLEENVQKLQQSKKSEEISFIHNHQPLKSNACPGCNKVISNQTKLKAHITSCLFRPVDNESNNKRSEISDQSVEDDGVVASTSFSIHTGNSFGISYECLDVKREPIEFVEESIFPD